MVTVHSTHAEPMLPAASRLLRRIAAAPGASLTAAIVGPGGTGKSTLLDAVSAAYERAGCPVTRTVAPADLAGGLGPNGAPVLVDDAHRLDADAIAALRSRARTDGIRMVVAYRPWPRPEGLSALGAQLSRHHSPIVVGHLDRDEVAERIARRAGCAPPESLVSLVHEQSGGSPMFVGLVTQALLDIGRLDPSRPESFRRPPRITVSPGLAERLRYQLEGLDPGIHDLLEALALGAALDADVLGALLDLEPAHLTDTVEAAYATGLLTDSGELIVFVRNLVLRLMPILRCRNLQRRLAEIQLDRGGSVLAAGRRLAESGATGTRASAVLAAAADEALPLAPQLSGELLDAAVRAGAGSRELAARRAHAAALAGDTAQALRFADTVLTDDHGSATDRRRAVTVTAAVLAQRGFAARTAELYRGAGHDNPDALLAVPALLAAGELAEARDVLAAAPPSAGDAPTLVATASRLVAIGMLASVEGDLAVAVSHLARASSLLEPAGDATLLAYSPAALAAVVAAQCGEVGLADSTLGNAVAAKLGGGLAHTRHLLLHGWNATNRGSLDTARDILDRVSAREVPLEPGDELLAAALATGLARRAGDQAALANAFARARTALIRHPVDLYLLRPLGELAVAAAELGERPSLAAHLDQAWVLLARLGDPPLWSAPLHWSELQAALAVDDLASAQRSAAALSTLADSARHVAGLAEAGTCAIRVAGEERFDPADVRTAATGLYALGLGWDGAQLAATAALRTADRKAAAALLACARNLSDSVDTVPASSTGASEQAAEQADQVAAPQLSERELEVGRLVLAGLTYKQIGARLFISSKTVEHHVARMRSRLGADGRDELFGRLRALLTAAERA